jgi:hypothetical protein
MSNTTNKKFLDESGLAILWDRITAGFAPRWMSYRPKCTGDTDNLPSKDSIVTQSETDVKIPFVAAGVAVGSDGQTVISGHNIVATIPAASQTWAGVMSKADKTKLDNLNSSITGAINISNFAVEGNQLKTATVNGKNTSGTTASLDKCINLGISYSQQKIQLLDRNNTNKEVASIDLTDIIKDRFLSDVSIVDKKDGESSATGLYLRLVFLVKDLANNTDSTEVVYVDTQDLVDVYTAGTGLEITAQGGFNDAGNDRRTTEIKLKPAATNEIGGIAVYKTYTSNAPEAVTQTTTTKRYFGVELGKDNKAIVNVPIGTLTAGNNVKDATAVTLNPTTGGSVELVYGINSTNTNAEGTGNVIALSSKTINLGKETEVSWSDATTATSSPKFGETITALTSVASDSKGTNGHKIQRTKTTFTLPSLTGSTVSPGYVADDSIPTGSQHEIVADNNGSRIIVPYITGITITPNNEGNLTLTTTQEKHSYWVNVTSIPDSFINGLTYPAN